jgi:hypothetical protein
MSKAELAELEELHEVLSQVIRQPDRKLRFQTPQNEIVQGFLKDIDGIEFYLWVHRSPITYSANFPVPPNDDVSR